MGGGATAYFVIYTSKRLDFGILKESVVLNKFIRLSTQRNTIIFQIKGNQIFQREDRKAKLQRNSFAIFSLANVIVSRGGFSHSRRENKIQLGVAI